MPNTNVPINDLQIILEAISYISQKLDPDNLGNQLPDPEIRTTITNFRLLADDLVSKKQALTNGALKNIYIALSAYREFLEDTLDKVSGNLRDETLSQKQAVNAAMRDLRKAIPDIAQDIPDRFF